MSPAIRFENNRVYSDEEIVFTDVCPECRISRILRDPVSAELFISAIEIRSDARRTIAHYERCTL